MNTILCCGRTWIKINKFYRSLCPKPECVTVSIYNSDSSIETWTITDDFIDYLPVFDMDKMLFFTIEASNDIKTVVRIFSNPLELEDETNIYKSIISSTRSKSDIIEIFIENSSEHISIMDNIVPLMWSGNILTLDIINTLLGENYNEIKYIDSNFDEKIIDKDHTLIL